MHGCCGDRCAKKQKPKNIFHWHLTCDLRLRWRRHICIHTQYTHICFIFHQPRQTCSRPHEYTYLLMHSFYFLFHCERARTHTLAARTLGLIGRTSIPIWRRRDRWRIIFYQMLLLSSPRTILMQFYHSKKSHRPQTFQRNVMNDGIAIPQSKQKPLIQPISIRWHYIVGMET